MKISRTLSLLKFMFLVFCLYNNFVSSTTKVEVSTSLLSSKTMEKLSTEGTLESNALSLTERHKRRRKMRI